MKGTIEIISRKVQGYGMISSWFRTLGKAHLQFSDSSINTEKWIEIFRQIYTAFQMTTMNFTMTFCTHCKGMSEEEGSPGT